MTGGNQIEIFQTEGGEINLEVSLDKETVWLSLKQLTLLFSRDKSVISRHIRNIFKDEELSRDSVVANFATTASDGKSYQVEYFNLDVIISVGYRVKSKRGVQFRQWATRVLKNHLVNGYSLNQKRLKEQGIEFEQALTLLSTTLKNQSLISSDGEAIIKVIQNYARSWSLLHAYDEQSLMAVNLKHDVMQPLVLEDTLKAIAELKRELISKGEASDLFAQLRGSGLHSALSQIEQGFGDEWLYPNIASRAAHLFYFVIKNHPFADGNKRTASFLFLWYLRINQSLLSKPLEMMITDTTLVSLALLIAESLPEQKELMIHLIEHFIEVR